MTEKKQQQYIEKISNNLFFFEANENGTAEVKFPTPSNSAGLGGGGSDGHKAGGSSTSASASHLSQTLHEIYTQRNLDPATSAIDLDVFVEIAHDMGMACDVKQVKAVMPPELRKGHKYRHMGFEPAVDLMGRLLKTLNSSVQHSGGAAGGLEDGGELDIEGDGTTTATAATRKAIPLSLWEYFQWKMKLTSSQEILKNKKIKFGHRTPGSPTASTQSPQIIQLNSSHSPGIELQEPSFAGAPESPGESLTAGPNASPTVLAADSEIEARFELAPDAFHLGPKSLLFFSTSVVLILLAVAVLIMMLVMWRQSAEERSRKHLYNLHRSTRLFIEALEREFVAHNGKELEDAAVTMAQWMNHLWTLKAGEIEERMKIASQSMSSLVYQEMKMNVDQMTEEMRSVLTTLAVLDESTSKGGGASISAETVKNSVSDFLRQHQFEKRYEETFPIPVQRRLNGDQRAHQFYAHSLDGQGGATVGAVLSFFRKPSSTSSFVNLTHHLILPYEKTPFEQAFGDDAAGEKNNATTTEEIMQRILPQESSEDIFFKIRQEHMSFYHHQTKISQSQYFQNIKSLGRNNAAVRCFTEQRAGPLPSLQQGDSSSVLGSFFDEQVCTAMLLHLDLLITLRFSATEMQRRLFTEVAFTIDGVNSARQKKGRVMKQETENLRRKIALEKKEHEEAIQQQNMTPVNNFTSNFSFQEVLMTEFSEVLPVEYVLIGATDVNWHEIIGREESHRMKFLQRRSQESSSGGGLITAFESWPPEVHHCTSSQNSILSHDNYYYLSKRSYHAASLCEKWFSSSSMSHGEKDVRVMIFGENNNNYNKEERKVCQEYLHAPTSNRTAAQKHFQSCVEYGNWLSMEFFKNEKMKTAFSFQEAERKRKDGEAGILSDEAFAKLSRQEQYLYLRGIHRTHLLQSNYSKSAVLVTSSASSNNNEQKKEEGKFFVGATMIPELNAILVAQCRYQDAVAHFRLQNVRAIERLNDRISSRGTEVLLAAKRADVTAELIALNISSRSSLVNDDDSFFSASSFPSSPYENDQGDYNIVQLTKKAQTNECFQAAEAGQRSSSGVCGRIRPAARNIFRGFQTKSSGNTLTPDYKPVPVISAYAYVSPPLDMVLVMEQSIQETRRENLEIVTDLLERQNTGISSHQEGRGGGETEGSRSVSDTSQEFMLLQPRINIPPMPLFDPTAKCQQGNIYCLRRGDLNKTSLSVYQKQQLRKNRPNVEEYFPTTISKFELSIFNEDEDVQEIEEESTKKANEVIYRSDCEYCLPSPFPSFSSQPQQQPHYLTVPRFAPSVRVESEGNVGSSGSNGNTNMIPTYRVTHQVTPSSLSMQALEQYAQVAFSDRQTEDISGRFLDYMGDDCFGVYGFIRNFSVAFVSKISVNEIFSEVKKDAAVAVLISFLILGVLLVALFGQTTLALGKYDKVITKNREAQQHTNKKFTDMARILVPRFAQAELKSGYSMSSQIVSEAGICFIDIVQFSAMARPWDSKQKIQYLTYFNFLISEVAARFQVSETARFGDSVAVLSGLIESAHENPNPNAKALAAFNLAKFAAILIQLCSRDYVHHPHEIPAVAEIFNLDESSTRTSYGGKGEVMTKRGKSKRGHRFRHSSLASSIRSSSSIHSSDTSGDNKDKSFKADDDEEDEEPSDDMTSWQNIRDEANSKNEEDRIKMPEIRVGIHAGPIFYGAMLLNGNAPHFDVYGKSMSIAHRMQATSLANRIHLTASFRDLIVTVDMQDMFEYDKPRKTVLSGNSGTISSYLVHSAHVPMPEELIVSLAIDWSDPPFTFELTEAAHMLRLTEGSGRTGTGGTMTVTYKTSDAESKGSSKASGSHQSSGSTKKSGEEASPDDGTTPVDSPN